MPTELINILVQLPIVAAFIWFSYIMNKQFQEFLREERQARKEQLDGIVAELKIMNERLTTHDKQAAENFARIRERDERQSGRNNYSNPT